MSDPAPTVIAMTDPVYTSESEPEPSHVPTKTPREPNVVKLEETESTTTTYGADDVDDDG